MKIPHSTALSTDRYKLCVLSTLPREHKTNFCCACKKLIVQNYWQIQLLNYNLTR